MNEVGESRAEKAARNQGLFREVNERLREMAEAFSELTGAASFTCECADITCVEQMSLSLDEYEAVRAHANHFVVLPGHVYADVERVVSENGGFVIVEKLGEAAAIAVSHDPRARTA
jgi:hypothetical protein